MNSEDFCNRDCMKVPLVILMLVFRNLIEIEKKIATKEKCWELC